MALAAMTGSWFSLGRIRSRRLFHVANVSSGGTKANIVGSGHWTPRLINLTA